MLFVRLTAEKDIDVVSVVHYLIDLFPGSAITAENWYATKKLAVENAEKQYGTLQHRNKILMDIDFAEKSEGPAVGVRIQLQSGSFEGTVRRRLINLTSSEGSKLSSLEVKGLMEQINSLGIGEATSN